MNKMKSLLLGSAVGLLAVNGALAADLPVAEPVEYVKVCETYGVGFMYIPGTDTCIKVGGYVRFEISGHEGNIAEDRWLGSPFTISGDDDNLNDTYNMYVRGLVNFDARTETEYGTLRSFIQIRGNALDQDNASVELDLAFLQFAGFTAGLAPSILDFATVGTYGDQLGDWNHDTIQLAYTHQFGGGLSATVGVESNEREQTSVSGLVLDKDAGETYASESRTESPAVAAALRVNQGWGEAMLGGVVRQVQGVQTFDDDGDIVVDADDEFGWAVNAGLKVNLPMIAKGDHIVLRAAYGEGASRAIANFGLADGSLDLDGDDEILTNELMSAYAGFTHYWTDTVRSNFAASYATGDINVDAETEFSAVTASANVIWSPVKNLDVGLEVLYSSVDIDEGGKIGSADADSDDGFGAIFRIQRNFGN